MTISAGPGSGPVEEEVPAVVAVGRTVGGILLVLIGGVLTLAGAFWYFIVPFFSWTMEGFWYQMGEWAELGGVVVGIIGILLLIVGGALVQPARKKRLQIFMDAEEISLIANAQASETTEKRTAEQPPRFCRAIPCQRWRATQISSAGHCRPHSAVGAPAWREGRRPPIRRAAGVGL